MCLVSLFKNICCYQIFLFHFENYCYHAIHNFRDRSLFMGGGGGGGTEEKKVG